MAFVRIVLVLLCVSMAAAPLAAQDHQPSVTQVSTIDLVPKEAARPKLLLPLYFSFGALQVLDAHSTYMAVQSGAREANPVVSSFSRQPIGMAVLKGATVAAVIVANEKLWHGHRAASVVTMIALNSAYAIAVSHNYQVQRQLSGR